jgi:hypothetical protein
MLVSVATAQEQTTVDSVSKAKRVKLVASIFGGTYGASFIALNKAWYANYPRSYRKKVSHIRRKNNIKRLTNQNRIYSSRVR